MSSAARSYNIFQIVDVNNEVRREGRALALSRFEQDVLHGDILVKARGQRSILRLDFHDIYTLCYESEDYLQSQFFKDCRKDRIEVQLRTKMEQ